MIEMADGPVTRDLGVRCVFAGKHALNVTRLILSLGKPRDGAVLGLLCGLRVGFLFLLRFLSALKGLTGMI